MPHWYLASWEWDTTDVPHWRPPAGAVASLDLRSLADQGTPGPTAGGSGFFGFNTTQTLPGAEYFGDDITASLNLNRRNAWRNKLGIVAGLDNTRLVDILAETLGQKATPGGNVRAKPAIPTTAGRIEVSLGAAGKVVDREFGGTGDVCWPNIRAVEQDGYRTVRNRCLVFALAIENCTQGDGSLAARITTRYATSHGISFAVAQATLAQTFRDKFKRYLGGLVRKYRRWSMARQLFIPGDLNDEGDLPPETTITESFPNDAADLGAATEDLDWTVVTGTWTVSSGQCRCTLNGVLGLARAESDLSSADHYAQAAVIHADSSGTRGAGTVVRFDSAAATGYFALIQDEGVDDIWLYKVVTGTQTLLSGPTNFTEVAEAILKTEVNGSTLKAIYNGDELISITDTAISTGTRTGLRGLSGSTAGSNQILDSFEAADLAAGGGGASPNMLLMGVG